MLQAGRGGQDGGVRHARARAAGGSGCVTFFARNHALALDVSRSFVSLLVVFGFAIRFFNAQTLGPL